MKANAFRLLLHLVVIIAVLVISISGAGATDEANKLKDTLSPGDPIPPNPNVKTGTLENGLTYYVMPNGTPENRAYLELVVKAGSVLEKDDQRGMAHFVEHMAFNGTRNFPRQALLDFAQNIGMRLGHDLNAYTGFDETIYTLEVPTHDRATLEKAVMILSDWAHGLSFDLEEIEKERGVVIEEWRASLGAGSRLRDRQWPELVKGSCYEKRLPIGNIEVLKSFDPESLIKFYEKWYTPDRMAVIVVGAIDPEDVENLIRKNFADISAPQSPAPDEPCPVPDHEEVRVSVESDAELPVAEISIYFKHDIATERTVADYKRLLTERLFSQMLLSRLTEDAVYSNPPFFAASSVDARLLSTYKAHVLSIGVDDDGVEQGLDALLNEIEKIKRHGFSQMDLDRGIRRLSSSIDHYARDKENIKSEEYADEFSRNFLYAEPFPGPDYELALIDKYLTDIPLEDVNALIDKFLSDSNRVVLVSVPEKPDVELPKERTLQAIIESADVQVYVGGEISGPEHLIENMPEPGEIVSENRLETIGVVEWKLSNGATASFKKSDFNKDELLFGAFSPGGTSLASGADLVPALTAVPVVLSGGVSEIEPSKLNALLDEKNLSVIPHIEELWEEIYGEAAMDDVETMLELSYLYFTAPRERPFVFDSLKKALKELVEKQEAVPEMLFANTVMDTLMQGSPRSMVLNTAMIEKMDLERSFRFYTDRYSDFGDFIFIFVGNIDEAEMKGLVKKYIASLPSAGRVEKWRDTGLRPPRGIIKKEIHKGMADKSRIYLAFTGQFEWSLSNEVAVEAMSEVLQIRLFNTLREDLSSTYYPSVTYETSRYPVGTYAVAVDFYCSPDRVEEIRGEIFKQIELLKSGVNLDADLSKVKEIMKSENEKNLKDNEFWLDRLVYHYKLGLDPSRILSLEQSLNEVTARSIQDTASELLDTENYIQVIMYPEEVEER